MRKARKVPNPTDKYVGARVRIRRLQLGLSQEKLGDALGITFQQVQKYEKGTNRISSSRLQQISNILSVPVAFFFEGAPNATGHASAAGAPSIASQDPELIANFFTLPGAAELATHYIAIGNNADRRKLVDVAELVAQVPRTTSSPPKLKVVGG